MTITSLAATSLSAILPSGETLDLVMPGIFSVVACGRTRGVWLPEFCRTGGLYGESLVMVRSVARNEVRDAGGLVMMRNE